MPAKTPAKKKKPLRKNIARIQETKPKLAVKPRAVAQLKTKAKAQKKKSTKDLTEKPTATSSSKKLLGAKKKVVKSTHSTPRSEARGMLRVDTERRFLPRFKNRGLAPSNVSKSVRYAKKRLELILCILSNHELISIPLFLISYISGNHVSFLYDSEEIGIGSILGSIRRAICISNFPSLNLS